MAAVGPQTLGLTEEISLLATSTNTDDKRMGHGIGTPINASTAIITLITGFHDCLFSEHRYLTRATRTNTPTDICPSLLNTY